MFHFFHCPECSCGEVLVAPARNLLDVMYVVTKRWICVVQRYTSAEICGKCKRWGYTCAAPFQVMTVHMVEVFS